MTDKTAHPWADPDHDVLRDVQDAMRAAEEDHGWPGHGDVSFGVVDEPWHHGEALPTVVPGEGCER